MRALDGELLLEAWERGAANLPIARPLALLESADDSSSGDVAGFADLSLAERNARLFRLRQMTFGDRMRGVLPCESCSARIEFEVSIEPILTSMEQERVREASWLTGSLTFTMRPVTTRDLAEIATAADPRRELLQLCTSVEGADAMHALAEHEHFALEHFEELNRNAETRFRLTCPACGASDHVDLDIGAFLWTEVRHKAITLLRDVHELACAYGWSEAEILAISAARRSTYLEMTG